MTRNKYVRAAVTTAEACLNRKQKNSFIRFSQHHIERVPNSLRLAWLTDRALGDFAAPFTSLLLLLFCISFTYPTFYLLKSYMKGKLLNMFQYMMVMVTFFVFGLRFEWKFWTNAAYVHTNAKCCVNLLKKNTRIFTHPRS